MKGCSLFQSFSMDLAVSCEGRLLLQHTDPIMTAQSYLSEDLGSHVTCPPWPWSANMLVALYTWFSVQFPITELWFPLIINLECCIVPGACENLILCAADTGFVLCFDFQGWGGYSLRSQLADHLVWPRPVRLPPCCPVVWLLLGLPSINAHLLCCCGEFPIIFTLRTLPEMSLPNQLNRS